MLYFKVCPKLQGDIHLDQDMYAPFRKCLQCGLIDDVNIQQPGIGLSKSEKIAAWINPKPVPLPS